MIIAFSEGRDSISVYLTAYMLLCPSEEALGLDICNLFYSLLIVLLFYLCEYLTFMVPLSFKEIPVLRGGLAGIKTPK